MNTKPNQESGYMGDVREFGPSYDAYLMRREAECLVDMENLPQDAVDEITKTVALLTGIVTTKGN